MSNLKDLADPRSSTSGSRDFVTVTIADQLFGVPVLLVQDVLGPQKITRIPLAQVLPGRQQLPGPWSTHF